MKKTSLLLIIVGIILTAINVNAANYQMKELIPVNIKTTIVTNHFSYKRFMYDDNHESGDTLHNNAIVFEGIKNLQDEEKPITISIGLFDKNKKNIGTINYCSSVDKKNTEAKNLASKEEIAFKIPVDESYLKKGTTVRDIKYIAVISDNINCHYGGSDEYVGQTVEEIGMIKNTSIDDDSKMFFYIILGIGGLLLLLFLYRFVFTTYYSNVDGQDVRQGYNEYNDELKREREKENKLHPPKPPEVIREKTEEVIAQEEQAKEETTTDLHNMYK